MRKYVIALAAIAVFISFFRLGAVTLFDVDEAVFAQATKEMVESGDWITPTYNGVNRYDKPIFFYWLMAGSYKAFGINEFAARFPSALSGILLAMSLFLFAAQFGNAREAFYAAVSFLVSVYFFMYSHAAVTDMALSLFITLSLFSFFLSLKKNHLFIYGFYAFSALAFLTKGLIGIVFPFGIAIIYLFASEQFRGIRKVFDLKAVFVFLVVALPWYTAEYMANGNEFIQQLFIKHHFARYAGVISGHKGPIYYYVPVMIAGLFPWIAFLPAGITAVISRIRSRRDIRAGHDDPGLFLLTWFCFIFAFFSFSTTKLPNYILPAIPAVSILISKGMFRNTEPSDFRWAVRTPQGKRYAEVFIAIASLVIGVAFVFSKAYLENSGIHDAVWTYYAAAIMCMLTLGCLYALLKGKSSYGYISAAMVALLGLISATALPAASQYLQGTLYEYSKYAGSILKDDEKIVAYGMNNPSIVFYSGHRIINVRSQKKLAPELQPNTTYVAITKERDVAALKELGFGLVKTDGRYALLERK
ncbi:MAG TPA: glycosyltransferase family 39 protein [Thermodesulfovibrionales bacterium]|nr:glycosyltransferase family 39 protein [Thermodesulfovibrionales bacterium]